MNPPPITLQFDNATTEANPVYESAIWNVTFELAAGGLMLVRLETEHQRLPLADAAEGLEPLRHGAVRFMGENWEEMEPDHANEQRGKIGRVFEGEGWLSDLNVDENILLSQRHHSDRPEAALFEEASHLAHTFGLPGLPRGLPSSVRRQDLRKAEIVRALLGQPQLIILESPTRSIYDDIIAPLVNTVQHARKHGAAVLWTSSAPEVWNNTGLHATTRGRMYGSQLHLIES